MNDWFQWNGKRCTEYGIHVSDQPPLTLPAERVTFTDVPGRSGSLTTTEGEYVYEDMVLTAQCFILSGTRVPEIAAWLRGSGTVTFANRPEGYYEARIINQIPFEKILRGNPHLAFAVNFRCKPFWYQKNISPITLTQSGSFVENPSSVFAEPIITVYGTGAITLMVGMIITELEGISGSITLNSQLQEAYSGTTSMNGAISGEFPVLLPGQNAVSWTGNVTSLNVIPNWRFL